MPATTIEPTIMRHTPGHRLPLRFGDVVVPDPSQEKP
jgi:hypothetical protein